MDKHRLDLLRPTAIPLHLSVNVVDDWLEAIEFGSVVDGRPDSQLVEVSADIRYVLRAPGGPVCGFTVHNVSSAPLEWLETFDAPRFASPRSAWTALRSARHCSPSAPASRCLPPMSASSRSRSPAPRRRTTSRPPPTTGCPASRPAIS